MAERKYEIVQDDVPPETTRPARDTQALQTLLLAIKALSQRAFVAILDSFSLVVVVLAFWLWLKTPDPNAYQIVSNTLFGIFGLAAIMLVRFWR